MEVKVKNSSVPASKNSARQTVETVGDVKSSTNTKSLILLAFALFFIILLFGAIMVINNKPQIASYSDCVNAPGNIVTQSYPATCITKAGERFVQELTEDEQKPLLSSMSITSPSPISTNDCQISGCSGEICQNADEEPIITDCLYLEKFACYADARCEKQADDNCGWTQTDELTSCLEKYE